MLLFSYIVRSDNGFSPNPFHGCCTLACCKPGIRRTAGIGDWIAGLTSKCHGHKLAFAMCVGEALSIAEYWNDARFLKKRANFNSPCGALGDNIYEPLEIGKTFRQHRSRHSLHNAKYPPGNPERYTEVEDGALKKRDLSGERVIISTEFVYFGTDAAVELPDTLRTSMAVGRGYRNRFSPQILTDWQAFIATLPRGIQGRSDIDDCLRPRERRAECVAPKVTKVTRNSGDC